MEKFLLGVYTMVPPAEVTNRNAADTGLDAAPDPPLTDAEFERVVAGAKQALLGVLRDRAAVKRVTARSLRDPKGDALKLTAPQKRELALLLKEPQPTYGKARTRVQNNLHGHGLVVFVESLPSRCELTAAGRAVAEGLRG